MDREFLDLYTDYLISSFGKVTDTGLSELLDEELNHDQITSRLRKCTGGSSELQHLVKPTIRKYESEDGVLIFDDTLEHKPYSKEDTIVGWYFDHSHNRSIKGINILNCVYHNEAISLPVAFENVQTLLINRRIPPKRTFLFLSSSSNLSLTRLINAINLSTSAFCIFSRLPRSTTFKKAFKN